MQGMIGLRNENAVPNEGKITFDIRFSVRVPKDNRLIKMIIDVEAQKKYYPGYDLVTRVLFSSKLNVSEKKHILEKEYHIPMTKNMERMAVEMCNLSDLIEEKGIQQGERRGIEMMARLSVRLAEDGKITEISRAASDRVYLEQLLKDYGITEK